MLAYVSARSEALAYTGVRPGDDDTLLAVPGTPMQSARVRLLRVDAATRAILVANGVTDSQRAAYIQVAPYRADCRTVRRIDTTPWVVRGDTGYARVILGPKRDWIRGVPVLVILGGWDYPYPRQRALAFDVPNTQRLASAATMYDFENMLEESRGLSLLYDSVRKAQRAPALAWAATNVREAELEPIHTRILETVIRADEQVARLVPSRMRGSYRVTLREGEMETVWYFRTRTYATGSWKEEESKRSIANLVASPHLIGRTVFGYAADSASALPVTEPRGSSIPDFARVWFSATDRPTVPGNDTVGTLRAQLEFTRRAAPPSVWDALDPFVPKPTGFDSAYRVRTGFVEQRGDEQPRLPLSIHIDATNRVYGDTTFVRGTRRLRITLERVDTVSIGTRTGNR